MNITKDNFNQYVAIASDLASEGLYKEATGISLEAFETWKSWTKDDDKQTPEDVDAAQALLTLTYSQWREVEDAEDCALLAEILNNNDYWSDEFIEDNLNFTGAWILREKALAYHMLAQKWATGQLYDVYTSYAQAYMNRAIDTFAELAKNENDADAAEICLDCKIDLAMIRRGISNKLARMTAITLFGENITDEQKERLMEIYRQATDVLFDDYFAKKGIAVVQHSEVEDSDVKDDVINYLLDAYSEPGNDNPYWWAFANKVSPDERKKIRFVEKIEDAADNDFDDIPWVFTLDRYPFDIEFEEGDEPVGDSVYEIDPQTDKYHRI